MTDSAPFDVKIVPVTPFQQNCSLVKAKDGACAVIDPGGEIDRLLQEVEAWGGRVEKIWLTHGHLDHAAGAMEMKTKTGAPIEGAHPEEAFWLDQMAAQAQMLGGGGGFGTDRVVPDRWLDDGDQVTLSNLAFDVLFTPGHTPGHVVFYHSGAKLAFVGDVLFHGSIGRTDFPRGDHATLIASITEKLWPLGPDVRFVPGHGPMSTFGEERRSNPFVADKVVGSAGENRQGPG
ncbi:glyoxalase II family protein [Parvularcula bermudensis HTCC2503]|uniref:Glyoxalase II family protein n=1 Tax=Parvularcula bermudensis (strain ATCC BAA-594 / HTCC2503 / KCTC 12087) TaxID=314260 RepID=E0TIC8_PARBH|nr:MBL fold metallo-hydrolase [Parvularcula bermudensis]ADM09712.1 glyoxalase II family protein [Parvularcula bermudensis HTCC2503]